MCARSLHAVCFCHRVTTPPPCRMCFAGDLPRAGCPAARSAADGHGWPGTRVSQFTGTAAQCDVALHVSHDNNSHVHGSEPKGLDMPGCVVPGCQAHVSECTAVTERAVTESTQFQNMSYVNPYSNTYISFLRGHTCCVGKAIRLTGGGGEFPISAATVTLTWFRT